MSSLLQPKCKFGSLSLQGGKRTTYRGYTCLRNQRNRFALMVCTFQFVYGTIYSLKTRKVYHRCSISSLEIKNDQSDIIFFAKHMPVK